MDILIVGASRGIGNALLKLALEERHNITVLARFPEKLADYAGIKVVAGDVRDADIVRKAAVGQQAVVSCVGTGITFKPVDLFSRGMANIIAAMSGQAAARLVAVTGIGAGDSKGHGGFLYDWIFKPLLLSPIYVDKDREEALIRASGLDWLIVRPAGLTNGPRTGAYRVLNDLTGITAKRISRLDVADFILRELNNPSQFGRSPLITY